MLVLPFFPASLYVPWRTYASHPGTTAILRQIINMNIFSFLSSQQACGILAAVATLDAMDYSILQPSLSPSFLIGLISLSWLLYRAYKILSIPEAQLVELLGLEIPSAPDVVLLDIGEGSVTVHWDTLEQQGKDLKFVVKADGRRIGEVAQQECGALISNLSPGNHSIVIAATNATNYHVHSQPIQVRFSSDTPYDSSISPVVTPHKAYAEYVAPAPAPHLSREHSGSYASTKRNSLSRRGSHNALSRSRATSEEHAPDEDVQALTSKLDALRVELQALQAQEEDEEAEFRRSMAEMMAQKEDLKRQLKERDDQNKDLNKSVKTLEHANSAAQNKKAQQEKALSDKLRGREKMKEDTIRWNNEMADLDVEAEALKKELEQVGKDTTHRVAEIKAEQKPDLDALADIEDQIQQRGKEVLELDKQKKLLEEEFELPDVDERAEAMAAEERESRERNQVLQNQIHEASFAVMQLKNTLAQMGQVGTYSFAGRSGASNGFIMNGYPEIEANEALPAQPAFSSQRINFDVPDVRPSQAMHNRQPTDSTGSFHTTSPNLPQVPKIPLPERGPQNASSSQDLVQKLTGGALTSPSVGGAEGLLPSDLLGDDPDDMVKDCFRGGTHRQSSSSISRPGSRSSRPVSTMTGSHSAGGHGEESLPGLGKTAASDGVDDLPNSPGPSMGSASPSVYASPYNSHANLHCHKSSDASMDPDRRSIRSASGGSRMMPSSWLSNAFTRQRGSTKSEDAPKLGSLKSSQSQSVPRDSDNLPGLGRRTTARSRGFFDFGKKGIDATSGLDIGNGSPLTMASSRPESTYSAGENAFPQPSENPRFGWDAPSRPGSIRAGWSQSHTASRRQSVQQDSSSGLLQAIGDSIEDHSEEENHRPSAPIGSRRKAAKGGKPTDGKTGKAKAPKAPKAGSLNPHARDFTTVFGFGKKSDKLSSKSKKTDQDHDEEQASSAADESSPAHSRKSRDTQPSSVAGSFEDITEEPDSMLTTPQDESAKTASSRTSTLLRRMTSKGNTMQMFGIKTKKPAEATEDGEEDSSSSKLGQSVESINSNLTPTATTPDKRSSTSAFFSSIGRRKKKADTPSVSDMSLASETGDDEDGRASTDGT